MVDFTKISRYQGPEDSPGYLLWCVSTKWRRSIEKSLRVLEITHAQFVVLACLGWLTRFEKKVSQIELAGQAGIDVNTLSQVLKCLQKKGWIQRLVAEDSRVKYPVLTGPGEEILSKAMPVVEKTDAHFFYSLKDSPTLIQTLKKLNNS